MNFSLYTPVFKNKNFMFLWLSQTTSRIAFQAVVFVLALLIFQTTKSNRAVAILMIASGLPAFLLNPFIGVIIDRGRRKLIMAMSNILRAIACLAFLLFPGNVAWSVFLISIFSIANAFFSPAESAVLPSYLTEKEIMPANSLFSFTVYTSLVLGGFFAGPALKLFGKDYVFIFLGALFFLSFILVALLPTTTDKGLWFKESLAFAHRTFFNPKNAFGKLDFTFLKSEFMKMIVDIKAGISYMKKNKTVAQASLILGATQVSDATLLVLAPGFSASVLHINLTDTSFVIMGPMVLGVALGAILVGQIGLHFNRRRGALRSYQIIAASIMLLGFTKRIPLSRIESRIPGFANSFFGVDFLAIAVLLIFILGFFSSFVEVPANATIQEKTDDNMRGRVYGVLSWFVTLTSALPVILSAFLADLLGVEKMALVIGISMLVSSSYIAKVAKEW